MSPRKPHRIGVAALLVAAAGCAATGAPPSAAPSPRESIAPPICLESAGAPADAASSTSSAPPSSAASFAVVTTPPPERFPVEGIEVYRSTVLGDFATHAHRHTYTMTFGANGELDLEVVLERSKLAMPSEKDWIREDRARFTGIAVWHDGGVIDGTLASADCGHCKIPPIDAYASDCIACGHAKLTCLDIPENVLFHDAPTASCRNRPVVSFLPAPTFVLQCVAHWSDPEGESEWKFAREGVESVVESWNPGSCDRLPRLMK